METPSSIRRVTRSQTLSAIKNSATNYLLSSKESDKCQTKPRQERSALLDISNESPIVGVAMQTPSSGKRKMSRIKLTPGSGEALLKKDMSPSFQWNLVPSPISLILQWDFSPRLRPTPPPQVVDFSQIVITSPVVAGPFRESSPVEQSNMFEESLELEKRPSITRSLLLDFSDKTE